MLVNSICKKKEITGNIEIKFNRDGQNLKVGNVSIDWIFTLDGMNLENYSLKFT